MDTLKEAFNKVKQDVEFLNNKINNLSSTLTKTREDLASICEILKEFSLINKKLDEQNKLSYEQNKNVNELIKTIFLSLNNVSNNPAHQPANPAIPTYNPAQDNHFTPQNSKILGISNGNEGVPADKQTNQQTNQQTDLSLKNDFLKDLNAQRELNNSSYNLNTNYIADATDVLNSLDNIKKEIRLKFKRLTEQEITVFSAIYQLDEENGYSDYKMLSNRLSLTESSIRDYIGRLIKKGIPIEKAKINNKQIQLTISSNLKKMATLNTILQLREL